jgi:ADP-ribosylglycohydrolase
MVGAIIGDILGAPFETSPVKTKDIDWESKKLFFTDDTVLTVATAYSILNAVPYGESYKLFYRKYPYLNYGKKFANWALSDNLEPYGSWGNGSAMRISPVALAYNNLTNILRQAKKSAEVTHNHIEGIKGAQAVAHSIFLARKGFDKFKIKAEISEIYRYDLTKDLEFHRKYANPEDISCQATVPLAILSFLESDDFEDSIRNAISLGVDSDTVAAISGSIAEAYYKKISIKLINSCLSVLDDFLFDIVKKFYVFYKLDYLLL